MIKKKDNKEILTAYADIVVKIGVNLQVGQGVTISSPVECAEFARIVAESAYRNGASEVYIDYSDEKFFRTQIENETEERIAKVPDWLILQKTEMTKEKRAFISISAGDPMIFEGIDPSLMQRIFSEKYKALDFFFKSTMSNSVRWCVIAYPTIGWAKKIFPDVSEAVAYKKLWNAIKTSMRLDEKCPVSAWQKHRETLEKRSKWLNDMDFYALKYKSSKGTDLTVGLADGHFWTGAFENAQDNIVFCANMPSEEIFTAPHKGRVDGTLVNALPLVHGGQVIDDFKLTFIGGRIVDFSAEKGYEVLKSIIETDEGTHHLGEVALIGKNSRISKQNILFYNTLFDENASCHLAIGEGYPTTLKNGNEQTAKERADRGLNESIEHVDFMIGTADLSIIGLTKDGEEIAIFENGEWII